MMKLMISVALGAAFIATPALAQGPGGGQRDQTRAEAQQRADMMFQMMDTNRDGVVTRDEAQQALAQFEAARGGAGGKGSERIQRMIDMAFGSGQSITQQQFEAQALARFDAMDLNHDGTVTAAERQQVRAMRQQGQGQGSAAQTTPPVVTSPVPVTPPHQ
jgi:Ca2+-binding EF-hand superfamily protein